jgi:hypothetical protein
LRLSGSGTTLDGVVIFLPVVLLLLAFGVLGGAGTNFVVLLPMVVMLGAGAFVVSNVLREARPPRNPSVRQLPTDHLRRQMFLALRPRRPRREQGKEETGN